MGAVIRAMACLTVVLGCVSALAAPQSEGQQQPTNLQSFLDLAAQNNPTLQQAQSQIDAARGMAYQAGLRLNPVVGYTSEQIGVNGTAGELHGGFVSQEFVRGGKLELSRAKYCQRVQIAETIFQAQYQRVANDVAIQFNKTIAAAQLCETQRALLENAKDRVLTHKEMVNVGQRTPAELLRAEVDEQRSELKLQTAENDYRQTWRDLAAFVGIPNMEPVPLAGSLEPDSAPLDWQAALDNLLASSPELHAARQKIQHDEIVVKRERIEPIPNITAQATVGYNFEADNTVAGVSVGLPLPVFDRNRGTIRQAQADLARSYAEVRRLELELQQRLAFEFRDYQSAWENLNMYQTGLLPKAKQAYEKLDQAYKERRAPWVDVLDAQRMMLDLQSEYVNHLLAYRKSDIAIRGLLLSGGLTEPPAPMSGGHLDAIPKPR